MTDTYGVIAMQVWRKVRALLKRKISRVLLALLACGAGAFLLINLLKSESAPIPQYQVATVRRGDIAVEITGSGNLAFAVKEDLAFEMAGTVEEVLVREGDVVQKGHVIARLDTSEWEAEVAALELELLQAKINLRSAELALDKAREDSDTDDEEIAIKKLQVKLAEGRYKQAQEALERARSASPEIVAPFDGFVASVHVSGGEEVKKGTVAVTLADPSRFKVDILVNEMDISQVKVGGKAVVQVDAAPAASYPARVVYVAPTATIQSGVVNYKVTVELESLQPAGLGQQMPSWVTVTPQTIELKEGLTTTVSIIVEERTNVLLIPNGAVISRGGQTYVQVISPTGAVETRRVQTGVTDYINREVIEGLSEGEKVVVPLASTATSVTAQQRPSGGIFVPGWGAREGR
jgi:RND family efflux transporter MFP subunit